MSGSLVPLSNVEFYDDDPKSSLVLLWALLISVNGPPVIVSRGYFFEPL